MQRFLLIENKNFFDKNNIVTVNGINDIPDRNAILFIGSHIRGNYNLNEITKWLSYINKKPYTYVIIAGKSDGILKNTISIPKNIIRIYANNTNYNHEKIKFLPMGSDWRSIASFSKGHIQHTDRPILCYCNFSLNTHSDRKDIFNMLKNKAFIMKENMGMFLKYSISRDAFFDRLGHSKFTICPKGNALDTFRFYDAIYSGSIPIVIMQHFHSYFQDVPVLYLKSKEDFSKLTEKFLLEQYEILSKKLKCEYECLDLQKFIDKINTEFAI
jgi:hypothetical protein